MKRPDRQNYPNGVFGDISYEDRLERYCSYLENQNKRLRIESVVVKEAKQLSKRPNTSSTWECFTKEEKQI